MNVKEFSAFIIVFLGGFLIVTFCIFMGDERGM